MIFNISALETQNKYRLLSGGITPRPIAWISTISHDNIDNLAPYSFFTVASCNPPVLLYTQVNPRTGVDKDTLTNLTDTGECVVNIVDSQLLEKMNMTSTALKPEESEFSFANVESCASSHVTPKSVANSPIRYECTLREVMTISDLPTGGTVVMLDVKSVYVRDDLYINDNIQHELIDSVGKMGGDYFSHTTDKVVLNRP
jgi:flavin reductase (DIM6/NTAB) family NADH-FMN oxidoreductase RutF